LSYHVYEQALPPPPYPYTDSRTHGLTEHQHPPPPYPYTTVLKSDPSLYCPPSLLTLPTTATPDPDSLGGLSEEGAPDTPDSSLKEEPCEEASEGCGGVLACLWRNCGREFIEKKYLVDHVTGMHIEHRKGCEDFPCFWENCSRRLKSFNAKYKLLTHMRVHTGEKPYNCRADGCHRSFARLENLKIHNRSHTGEKPFMCKFTCGKAFSNSSDRAKHEQTHKDPKPYRCEVLGCLKRYTDPSSLRKHVKNHTKDEQEAARLSVQGREDSNQTWEVLEGAGGSLGLMTGGGVVGYSQYTGPYTPPGFRRGEMHHQPNSLDSVDGDALPFDPEPLRYEPCHQENYNWS